MTFSRSGSFPPSLKFFNTSISSRLEPASVKLVMPKNIAFCDAIRARLSINSSLFSLGNLSSLINELIRSIAFSSKTPSIFWLLSLTIRPPVGLFDSTDIFAISIAALFANKACPLACVSTTG